MNDDFELESSIEPIDLTGAGKPIPKPFPVWSGWDILLLLFLVGFAALLVGTLSQAVQHILQVRFPTVPSLRDRASEGVFLVLFQAFLDMLIFLFIYFTITLKYNAPFLPSIKWTRIERPRPLSYVPLGVLLAVTVIGVSILVPSPERAPIEELLKDPMTAFLFAALGVLVAPFVEELLFRGFIYPVVERHLGKIVAVFVTSLLFMTVHLGQLWANWTAVVLIFLVGIVLSGVRARTDSLIPSFYLHLSYNTSLCLLFLIGSQVDGLAPQNLGPLEK